MATVYVVLTFESVLYKYFHMVRFVLYIVLTFESIDNFQVICDVIAGAWGKKF